MIKISAHRRPSPRWLRTAPLRFLLVPFILWFLLSYLFLSPDQRWAILNPFGLLSWIDLPNYLPTHPTSSEPLVGPIPCYGARGRLLSENPDDELRYGQIQAAYPTPFIGSQRELGLSRSWMTADGRYGPYGFGENYTTYTRSKVDWDSVDWGNLQDQCFRRNNKRFPRAAESVRPARNVRFSLFEQTKLPSMPHWSELEPSRRTAIVMRSYEGYNYTSEDMWNIRSIITEASLRTGGEYAVILLVNVFDSGLNITSSEKNYQNALETLNIPPELRSITLLWDEEMVETWYPDLEHHSSMWQINLPLQLLALHYPGFDHYWQIEMDQRFMGDVGEYMKAMARFARNEPRKQSLERATFPYSEELWASYADFQRDVNEANHGNTRAWGPVRIPDIVPIGPPPPTNESGTDQFTWGVGEDADVIVTSFCEDVRTSTWVFGGWIQNFERKTDTPRWFCPPAIMRGSRALLLAIHSAQHNQSLGVPSEAVLPSFALWHGMKLSYPPQPVYMYQYKEGEDRADDENEPTMRSTSEALPFWGAHPLNSDGVSHSNPQSVGNRGLTWWWASNWPRKIMDVWLSGNTTTKDLPSMLAVSNNEVYAPNFVMHPVKTA